jgi:hypothetical protein
VAAGAREEVKRVGVGRKGLREREDEREKERKRERKKNNDAHFRSFRLLADANATLKAEFGLDLGGAELVVVENTVNTHNVVVCTLCSCYPVSLLGRSPAW